MFLGLLFIINQGYWEETVETLALVVCRGRRLHGDRRADRHLPRRTSPRLYRVLRPVLDLMQTLPTFVYLIPALVLFGLGIVPGLIVTVDLRHPGADPAHPSRHRLGAEGAASRPARPSAPPGASCCGRSSCPAALPTIMAGLTQCIMLSLSMVVIAALVGADGLGKPVGARAQHRQHRARASRPASPSSCSPSSSTACTPASASEASR